MKTYLRCCIPILLLVAFRLAVEADEEPFSIAEIFHRGDHIALTFPARPGHYYILFRGETLDGTGEPIALVMPEGSGPVELRQPLPVVSSGPVRAFYRLREVPREAPLDSDGDGLDDTEELGYPSFLDPLDPADAELDYDNDGKSNRAELRSLFGPTNPADPRMTDVEFETADGFTIAASFGVPGITADRMPAVIFIHQGGSDRGEWEGLIEKVFLENWIVLAYDIRGHGESSGTWTNAWYNDPDNAPEDLVAAIAYLKANPKVDADRIGVVGASVGGNLACVASSEYGIRTAVAMSHKTSAILNLAGKSAVSMGSVFHIASAGDEGGARATWARELAQQTAKPSRVEIVPGSGHGVSIFATDPSLRDRIVAWLRETLP